jgi:hypothetical protein
MPESNCPYCGAGHVDGRCKECGDEYCDECLSEIGKCPNCDGRDDDAEPC